MHAGDLPVHARSSLIVGASIDHFGVGAMFMIAHACRLLLLFVIIYAYMAKVRIKAPGAPMACSHKLFTFMPPSPPPLSVPTMLVSENTVVNTTWFSSTLMSTDDTCVGIHMH